MRTLIGIIAMPFALVTHSFVIQEWWKWFIVPNGVRPITMVQAMIIFYAVRVLNSKVSDFKTPIYKNDTDNAHMFNIFLFCTLAPAAEWGVGWTINYFLPGGVY